MLIDMQKYKKSLADLWNVVFGDSYEYINNIYKEEYKEDILCFAEIEDEKAVSAFYLLRSCLHFDGKNYDGWYLYSAATLPEHRSKGLMGKLIKEAQQFCVSEGYDFISLVPANDGLYTYYDKFGFYEAMYYRSSTFRPSYISSSAVVQITDYDMIKYMRSFYKGNMFAFQSKADDYAISSLLCAGIDFLQLSESACCAFDSDEHLVLELICDEKEIRQAAEKLLGTVDAPLCTVLSPYDMSDLSIESTIVKFGMLYPIHKDLIREWKFTDIYMNLALN